MIRAQLTKRLIFGVCALFSAGLIGAAVQRAAAGGIPATGALAYAGQLRDAKGALLTGRHNIEIKLWSMGTSGEDPLCSVRAESLMLSDGRFSLGLPDDCVEQVHLHADLAVELLVDGFSLNPGGAPVTAVPYAIEAAHAVRSDRAVSAERADSAASADSATEATHAANADALEGRQASTFADVGHGHPLVDCLSVEGPCGVGTFNQPTYFLDRVEFACPEERPVMTSFDFVRCGELASPQEGLAVVARCCAVR